MLVGVLVGGGVNMLIVVTGPSIIPPPEGVDVSDMESIRNAIHLFSPRHFVVPFIAHSMGTLCGAWLAMKLTPDYGKALAYSVGLIFLAGGIAAATMIPAPLWFIVLDLVVAYIPMAWLATQFVSDNSSVIQGHNEIITTAPGIAPIGMRQQVNLPYRLRSILRTNF